MTSVESCKTVRTTVKSRITSLINKLKTFDAKTISDEQFDKLRNKAWQLEDETERNYEDFMRASNPDGQEDVTKHYFEMQDRLTQIEEFLHTCQQRFKQEKQDSEERAKDRAEIIQREKMQIEKELEEKRIEKGLQTSSTTPQAPPAPIQRPKLPQLTLPTFDGKFEDWLPFRDRYNQAPSMSSRTSDGIISITNITSNALASIRAIDAQVDLGQLLVSRIVTRKLDPVTLERFNQSLHDRTIPKLQDLLNFLDREMLTIQPATVNPSHGEPTQPRESFVKALGLTPEKLPQKVTIEALQSMPVTTITECVSVDISSLYHTQIQYNVKAFIIKSIGGAYPQQKMDPTIWKHLPTTGLADPEYFLPQKVELLLSTDLHYEIIRSGLIRGHTGEPVAQESSLGWLVGGGASSHPVNPSCNLTDSLDAQLRRFSEVEHGPSEEVKLTQEEKLCQEHYARTTTRLPDGNYQVELPFKEATPPLGNSSSMALKRYYALEAKFSRSPNLRKAYSKAFQDLIEESHLELVPKEEIFQPAEKCYFLPHHAVYKESSTTTKLRIVFDASAKTSSGQSLNSKLMVGPVIQEDLIKILIRWRYWKVPLTADIQKMYLYILVHPKHRDYLRIYWRGKTTEPIQCYRLRKVTFGTASAPYQAVRTLHQLAHDHGGEHPKAAEVLIRDFYMDDCLSGANSTDEAIELAKELRALTMRANFNLRKWSSSDPLLLSTIPEDVRETTLPLFMDQDGSMKALGLIWSPVQDEFRFEVQTTSPLPTTKRKILSEIAKVFDPLGFLAPVTIRAKCIMQELWKCQSGWDSKVPDHLLHIWKQYREETESIKKLRPTFLQSTMEQPVPEPTNSGENLKKVFTKMKPEQLKLFLAEKRPEHQQVLLTNQIPSSMPDLHLITKRHHVTDLIIHHLHLDLKHGGANLTLSMLQRCYWVIRGRTHVRKCINRCKICVIQKGVTVQQLMADLPECRVRMSPPFTHTGVDYAGPVQIRESLRRNARTSKAYIAVFVCLCTKAVTLELVSDLTTSAFLAALTRFSCRRIKPRTIKSDNGTTFVGANRELQDLWNLMKEQQFDQDVVRVLANGGTEWTFIPPAAPHQGGLWEAAVKSAKFHLRRVIGKTILTFELYDTLLKEVEACLNSRPLCSLTSDPNDLTALTPGHFLTGQPPMAIPSPDLTHLKVNRLDRWQQQQQMKQHFWNRWHQEYLQQLQRRTKWKTKEKNVEVGYLAVIQDDQQPPQFWKLGRIEK
ncbi:unnamed protein product, partial [Allacma fusca]